MGGASLLVPDRGWADHPVGAAALKGVAGLGWRFGHPGGAGGEKLAVSSRAFAALATAQQQQLSAEPAGNCGGHWRWWDRDAGVCAAEEVAEVSAEPNLPPAKVFPAGGFLFFFNFDL